MIITSEFFSFNVWEWFLHSSVLEWTESDLSKINWLRGIILLNPIVLVPWGRFPLCHTPIIPISAFRNQISILIVGCVTMWSRGSHQARTHYMFQMVHWLDPRKGIERVIECIGFEGFNQVKIERSIGVSKGGPNTSYPYVRGAQYNLIWVMREESKGNKRILHNLETTWVATFSFCL